MLAAMARQPPDQNRCLRMNIAAIPQSNSKTIKLVWPRESVRPIEGKQTSIGTTRNAHHCCEPAGALRTGCDDSIALASQCTPASRQSTLSRYHNATDIG